MGHPLLASTTYAFKNQKQQWKGTTITDHLNGFSRYIWSMFPISVSKFMSLDKMPPIREHLKERKKQLLTDFEKGMR